jgi:RecB family exonuclease
VERLRLATSVADVPLAPALFGSPPSRWPRPAHEYAVLAGLGAGRERFRRILPLALEETRRSLSLPCDAAALADLARSRLAVLTEFDWLAPRRPALGPYFGFLGAIAERGDLRDREPFVTVLEALARCPWQTLLGKLLRLEPLPDTRGALPSVDALLIGNLLHRVLERIAHGAGVEARGSVMARAEGEGISVPWPDSEGLEAILAVEAPAVVRDAGIALPGFPRVLAERTRPFLERARALDFASGDALPAVLGVEVEGSVRVRLEARGDRVLRFRADRLDSAGDALRLTDYKAGKPVSEAKGAAKRREHFLAGVAAGRLLQVPAYAFHAGSGGSRKVVGRYLFARPDIEDEPAVHEVSSEDGEIREVFDRTLEILFGSWEGGSFFPRMLDEKGAEPQLCKSCPFSEACLRGDTGARRALARWLQRRAEPPSGESGAQHPAEVAFLAAWRIAEVGP